MSFDDHIRTALDRALTDAREHLDADLRAFAQDLTRAAADERTRAVQEAAETAAAAVRQQAQVELAQFRDATEKHTDELRHSSERQLNELRNALDEAHRTSQQQIDAARREARVEADEIRRASEARLAELTEATDRRIAELLQEVDALRTSAAAEDARATAATVDAVDRARVDAHQAALAHAARVADAIRALDEAGSLGAALETLAECAAREVDRAVVFVVKSDRLAGWHLSGFETSVPPVRSIDLSLGEAGLPGAVVRTGVAVSRLSVDPDLTGERQPALPPFAQDAGPRHALALPVTVGGTVVAVLYADAPRPDAPSVSSRWPAVLDVLARHASRLLEAMTVQQAVGLSLPQPEARSARAPLPGPLDHTGYGADEDAARRCARLLISEVRMFNEPLVDAGRRSRDLLSRLSGEIERARRIYEERVPPAVAARAEYFDQELVRTLADGDRSLLGST